VVSKRTAEKTSGNGLPGSVGAALIILGAVAAYFALGTLMNRDEGGAATEAPAREPFTVLTAPAVVESRAIDIVVNGRTEAGRRITVRAETTGQVTEIPHAEGDRVTTGAVLCRLDTDTRSSVLAEAQAAAIQAENDYAAAERLYAEGFAAEAALTAAEAARDAARARLAQARQELANIDIRAPFDGLVAETLVDPGDVLAAGAGCAVLADLSTVIIRGGIPARNAALLSEGDRARVVVDGRPPFGATVSFVSDVADPGTRAFRVEMVAEGIDNLPEGLEARAEVTARSEPLVRIPRNALVFDDDGRLGVRSVPDASGDEGIAAVRFVPARLVTEDATSAYVIGPEDGQLIIVRGQNYVRDGVEVHYLSAEGAPG
jgi:multidrug efflux system membrane fusion protein